MHKYRSSDLIRFAFHLIMQMGVSVFVEDLGFYVRVLKIWEKPQVWRQKVVKIDGEKVTITCEDMRHEKIVELTYYVDANSWVKLVPEAGAYSCFK